MMGDLIDAVRTLLDEFEHGGAVEQVVLDYPHHRHTLWRLWESLEADMDDAGAR